VRTEVPEPVRLFLDDLIALATQLLELRPVQDRDLSSRVADDPEFLQLARGFRDAFTADSEHVGNEFLGHDQAVGRQAVEGEQQPAAQLLVDRVMPIAYRGLGHLCDQGLRVAQ